MSNGCVLIIVYIKIKTVYFQKEKKEESIFEDYKREYKAELHTWHASIANIASHLLVLSTCASSETSE